MAMVRIILDIVEVKDNMYQIKFKINVITANSITNMSLQTFKSSNDSRQSCDIVAFKLKKDKCSQINGTEKRDNSKPLSSQFIDHASPLTLLVVMEEMKWAF